METDFQKFLDELRARVSVAEVVGAKVKLVRKGREYMGLCPFHNEKTPSFTVNEAFTIVSVAGRTATSSSLRWKPTACRLWMR